MLRGTRIALFAFLVAAIATLLDHGMLWQFTLDPARRLTMTAYWLTHAVLLSAIVLLSREAMRQDLSFRAALMLAAALVLTTLLVAILVADGQTLIEVFMGDAAPGALLIIGVALVLRLFWRMFVTDPVSPLATSVHGDEESSWGDVSNAVAAAPVAVVALFAWIAVFSAGWSGALLILDYGVQGHGWAELNWQPIVDRFWRRLENWPVAVFVAGVLVLWILLDKLLVRTTKSRQADR